MYLGTLESQFDFHITGFLAYPQEDILAIIQDHHIIIR